MQSRRHAATHVQTARGRTHARANARTHAHLHHVHVRTSHGAARTKSDGDIPARQEPFATVTGAKRTPTGASSGTPPPTLCGGTPGAFRRMAGLAATDDGSRSIAGVEWGVGAVLDRLHNNYNNATTGLPCPTPEWLQSAHHASLSTFETQPFAVAPLQSHAAYSSRRPAIRLHKGCACENGQKNGHRGQLWVVVHCKQVRPSVGTNLFWPAQKTQVRPSVGTNLRLVIYI